MSQAICIGLGTAPRRAGSLTPAQPGVDPAAQAQAFGHPRPEAAQGLARAAAAAGGPARGQRHGIHGAGAGAADGRDLQPLVFEQAVEHAPGEGTLGATALQGEVETARGHGLEGVGCRVNSWRCYGEPLRQRVGVSRRPTSSPSVGYSAIDGRCAIAARQRCRCGCSSPALTLTTRAKSTATTAVMSATLKRSGGDEVAAGQAFVQVAKNCCTPGQAALRPVRESARSPPARAAPGGPWPASCCARPRQWPAGLRIPRASSSSRSRPSRAACCPAAAAAGKRASS